MKTIPLSFGQVSVRARIGVPYARMSSCFRTHHHDLFEEAFGRLCVMGPYEHDQQVEFSYARSILEKDQRPCDVFSSLSKGYNFRNACFWRLIWLAFHAEEFGNLFEMSPMIALGSPLSLISGRCFPCLSGESHGPKVSLVSEEDIGRNKYSYLVIPFDAPSLVMGRVSSVPQAA